MTRATAWPKPATAADDDEADRQMLLLAIAELAVRRPGWDWTLGRLADRLGGRSLFEGFKRLATGDDAAMRAAARRVADKHGLTLRDEPTK